MSLEKKLKKSLSEAFRNLYQHELSDEDIALQPTRKEFEGAYTFVTFPYGKISKSKPEETAKQLGEYLLANSTLVERYNVVKGFLNLVPSAATWIALITEIDASENFGEQVPNGQKVMIEFSSPNTNKPLHLGHLRNNFLGDAASRILKANGYDVLKVNLVNDRGVHICKSMYAYQQLGKEETPQSAAMKGDHLIGKYYVKFDKLYKEEISQLVARGVDQKQAEKEAPSLQAAQTMLQQWEHGDQKTVALWEKMNSWVYEGFDETYDTMGIQFDKMYKESDTYLLGKDLVDQGLQSGVFFEKDDGSVWIDLTDEGMDQKLVRRGDGTAVYITQDMGTCDMKYQDFPFDKSVFVVGNEQDYHFKVLFTIMKKLGRSYADGLYHLSYGMVDLPSGKMKSREGTVVDADDLLQEMFDTAEKHTIELGKIEGMSDEEASTLYRTLGLGALKYFLLKVDPKKRMLFDPQESIEFQGHTGPFIQYTHARIAAILRRGRALDIAASITRGLALHPREADLIFRLSLFPAVIREAGKEYSPAVVANYIFDLAKDYNGFYQEVSIFGEEDKSLVQFRMALSANTAKVIKKGMELLGIEVPERM